MQDYNDIIVEALEVFFNHILYVRDIYPPHAFKKRRIYNTPVYVSIYPSLNTYLYNILKTLRELLKSKEFQCAEMLFYKDNNKKYESYKFELTIGKDGKNEDEHLLDFEEQLRCSLSILAERLKCLEKLPADTKFKVLLHTTHSAFVKLTHNSQYQDFVWLRDDLSSASNHQEISLLPVTQLDCVGLNLNAEIF